MVTAWCNWTGAGDRLKLRPFDEQIRPGRDLSSSTQRPSLYLSEIVAITEIIPIYGYLEPFDLNEIFPYCLGYDYTNIFKAFGFKHQKRGLHLSLVLFQSWE